MHLFIEQDTRTDILYSASARVVLNFSLLVCELMDVNLNNTLESAYRNIKYDYTNIKDDHFFHVAVFFTLFTNVIFKIQEEGWVFLKKYSNPTTYTAITSIS